MTATITPRSQADAPAAWGAALWSGTVAGDEVTEGRRAPRGVTWWYMGYAEIAAWFGVSASAVRNWRRNYAEDSTLPDGTTAPAFPTPDVMVGGRSPGWAPSREAEIRRWHASKPGQGAGGGRPRRQPE